MPVDAAAEFTVYRLQQYDLHGVSRGSRSSLVNVEARTLDANNLARKCVLARLTDLTSSQYHWVAGQGAVALLVLLPSNLTSLSPDHRQIMREIEATMLETETQMAVYFAYETEDLTEIFESVRTATNSDSASSAAAALLGSLSSDGYQMVISGSQSKAMNDMAIANVQGKLIGKGVEEQLPTIVVVAHYDAFGAAAELSEGGDSNGSGVAILLELARIFSRLYNSPRTLPRLNMMFLLSGGGYINYQGSKRFLEDHLDASDSPLQDKTRFVLCLDTLANGHTLRMHVSKKPKEGSAAHAFYQALETAGSELGVAVDMVHKKINLQEDTQAWEHEKFSMRKLPAFTLSRLENTKTRERGSILDTVGSVDVSTLTKHTNTIATALLTVIYNNSVHDILEDGLRVSEESISSWLSLMASQPRSPQLLAGKNNPLVKTLESTLKRFMSEPEPTVQWVKADKRDPDWVFYDVTTASMAAYAVKPAAFDFALTCAIISYLAAIYTFLQYFPKLYTAMVRAVSPQKTKVQ